MQTKSKQRLIGLLILLAILAIFLPLLFHNSRPSTQVQLSVKIPPKPKLAVTPARIQKKEQSELMPPTAVVDTASLAQESEPQQSAPAKPKPQLVKMKKATVTIGKPKAWTVQLGAFSDAKNANRLVSRLRKKGFDAYTRPIRDANGKRLLRVYVGPEIRRESATHLRDTLRMAFHLKGVVRKYKIRSLS